MNCIKTGCHVFLEEYQQYAYGDAFELEIDGGPGQLVFVYFFRLCRTDYKPMHDEVHFTVHKIEHWFDKEQTDQERNSTLISTSVTDHRSN